VVGKSNYTLPGLFLCLLEKLPKLTPQQTKKWAELGESLRKEFEELLGDNGVLLFPSYPLPAPKHGRPLLMPCNWIYTGIWNVLYAAATQVPMGVNEDGLPVGVQVITKQGNDHLSIAVAEELERAFGGWVSPGSLAKVTA
jgi:fatty acid amide hydrolase 2